ncbi:MAG TPA: response regulator transcription factor [Thermoanaerobaculia bacterium]|nr:response regulator transcription factor [Thermoanaerobaculia bacterium]
MADDHPVFREGLKRVFEASGDLVVVAEASTGEEALRKAKTTAPDVVVLDVAMPGRGGLETAQELKRLIPRVRILMLTALAEDHLAIRSLKEGADGYMNKGADVNLLIAAIRKVHAGGKYVSPALGERLAMSLESGRGASAQEVLSVRELQVLRLIGMGSTAREIAIELHLSAKTVSTYQSRIREKLNLRNNSEVIRYAIQIGLAPGGSAADPSA